MGVQEREGLVAVGFGGNMRLRRCQPPGTLQERCSAAPSTVAYAELLLSSKTTAWPPTAEQHLSVFRWETPAKARGGACSAWAGQPQPCLRGNCKPPGQCWLLERAAPANRSVQGKGRCKGQPGPHPVHPSRGSQICPGQHLHDGWERVADRPVSFSPT